MAEKEAILGLPQWPAPLQPDQQRDAPGSADDRNGTSAEAAESFGFKLRRVEGMCGAHRAALAEVSERLALLKVRLAWTGTCDCHLSRTVPFICVRRSQSEPALTAHVWTFWKPWTCIACPLPCCHTPK
jgi:hypothetical protein